MLRLSFDGKYNHPQDLERSILTQLEVIERNAGLAAASCRTGPERLLDLLDRLHHATGRKVVVLVDEYDKPILDVLHNPDLATANRDYLRGFYGIIKGSAEHVRFVFVTGVSMFSKVSLFSGLNNLKDISLDPRHATVCFVAATRTTISTRSSGRSSAGSTGRPSAPGTTAITGAAESEFTIPTTYSCCWTAASSVPTGSRPGRRPSCSGR